MLTLLYRKFEKLISFMLNRFIYIYTHTHTHIYPHEHISSFKKSCKLTTVSLLILSVTTYLYIPEPKLRTIIWATGNKIVVIWTPSNIRDSICVTF